MRTRRRRTSKTRGYYGSDGVVRGGVSGRIPASRGGGAPFHEAVDGPSCVASHASLPADETFIGGAGACAYRGFRRRCRRGVHHCRRMYGRGRGRCGVRCVVVLCGGIRPACRGALRAGCGCRRICPGSCDIAAFHAILYHCRGGSREPILRAGDGVVGPCGGCSGCGQPVRAAPYNGAEGEVRCRECEFSVKKPCCAFRLCGISLSLVNYKAKTYTKQ